MNPNTSPFAEAPFQQQPFEPPARRSSAKIWLIVAAAVAGLLLLGLLACGGILFLGMKGISNRPPTEQERQAVVTIGDLAPFDVQIARQEEREVWQTKRNLDGGLEIEYEYDPERAPGPAEAITLMSSVNIDDSEASARETYGMTIGAYQLGFRVYDVQSREQSHRMTGVDQSHFALVVTDEKPVGNTVVIRQGKRVHGLLLIGLYFEDPKTLEDLLRPTIDRSAGIPLR
jgi:hypothetical protein